MTLPPEQPGTRGEPVTYAFTFCVGIAFAIFGAAFWALVFWPLLEACCG